MTFDYLVVNESNQTHLFTIDQIFWIDIIFVLFITISITFTCVNRLFCAESIPFLAKKMRDKVVSAKDLLIETSRTVIKRLTNLLGNS